MCIDKKILNLHVIYISLQQEHLIYYLNKSNFHIISALFGLATGSIFQCCPCLVSEPSKCVNYILQYSDNIMYYLCNMYSWIYNRPQTANTNANVQFSLPFLKWFQIDWTLASLVKVVWPCDVLDII